MKSQLIDQRFVRSTVLAVALAVAAAGQALAAPETAVIGMPFSGRWDQEGIASPGSHGVWHSWAGAQWSSDFYAAEGTAVSFYAFDESVPWWPYVWGKVKKVADVPNCTADAGKYVVVDIHNIYNQKIGVVVYVHLDAVAVTEGSTIGSFQTLGKLKYWSYSNCWQVNSSGGTHVHMEFGSSNAGQAACWMNYSAGAWLGSSSYIARVGTTNTSSPAACP